MAVEEDELLVAVGLGPVLSEVEEGDGDEEEGGDLGEEISGQDLGPHETLHLSSLFLSLPPESGK